MQCARVAPSSRFFFFLMLFCVSRAGRTYSEEGSLESAIGTDGRTKLVWVETPANPSWTAGPMLRLFVS